MINEIISKEAFEQVDLLLSKLKEIRSIWNDLGITNCNKGKEIKMPKFPDDIIERGEG